jgi:hypothetical protein
MRPDFDKAPDRRAIYAEAVRIAQNLGDLAVTFSLPAQVANDLGDRLKLALKGLAALELCRSCHPAIETEIIGSPGASGRRVRQNKLRVDDFASARPSRRACGTAPGTLFIVQPWRAAGSAAPATVANEIAVANRHEMAPSTDIEIPVSHWKSMRSHPFSQR